MVRAMRGKLAPVIGIRRNKDEQANKDIRIQNQAVLVGFRSAYVFEELSRDLWPRL
jgi:hypothetical protein